MCVDRFFYVSSCNRDGKIQGSILSSGWERRRAHTFRENKRKAPLEHSKHDWVFFFLSLKTHFTARKLHAQTGKMCERTFFFLSFFHSPCVLLFFTALPFFLLIIRIYLKIKSHICIKETHWNYDNGPVWKTLNVCMNRNNVSQ